MNRMDKQAERDLPLFYWKKFIYLLYFTKINL